MDHQLQARVAGPTDAASPVPWLFLAEIEHRVANEYALAVASISLAASRTSNLEARATLGGTAQRLRDFANVHRSLRTPASTGEVELAAYLGQLCHALSRARLDERRISLSLVTANVLIESQRCWRVGLIVSELITNCVRHGFNRAGGEIAIQIARSRDAVLCTVSDNGRAACGAALGRGGQIVDSLAKELGGFVERRYGARGTTVVLSFPEHDPHVTTSCGASRRGTEDFTSSTSKRELLPTN
jgi:two-component sensor histidine kinase